MLVVNIVGVVHGLKHGVLVFVVLIGKANGVGVMALGDNHRGQVMFGEPSVACGKINQIVLKVAHETVKRTVLVVILQLEVYILAVASADNLADVVIGPSQ